LLCDGCLSVSFLQDRLHRPSTLEEMKQITVYNHGEENYKGFIFFKSFIISSGPLFSWSSMDISW
jgi:hypothetical protein